MAKKKNPPQATLFAHDMAASSARADMWHIGIDEAGRGCLAGPVVAAAVLLPESMSENDALGTCNMPELQALNDSKKCTAKKRQELFIHIKKHAVAYGIGIMWQKDIDSINILQATFHAMAKATKSLMLCYAKKLGTLPPSLLCVDGNKDVPLPILATYLQHKNIHNIPKQQSFVGGDGRLMSIAAASIIAKTHRDSLLLHYHKKWPHYNFAAHKGYGTKEHIQSIAEHGSCPLHRLTFAKVLPEVQQKKLMGC